MQKNVTKLIHSFEGDKLDETNKINRLDILNQIGSKEEEKDILEYPEAECLLKHARKKMRDKRDWKCLFSGGTGTGKSESGARFLELWYKKQFNEKFPVNHIVSDLGECILLIKKFKRKGEGILLEEISTSVGSRDSQTTQNKLWNKILDTMRIKQVVLVMNAPHITFLDKHIRMCLDCWCDCKSVDFDKQICLARPLWLQTSPHKAEPYKHKYIDKEGLEIEYCYFKKCSKYILEYYSKKKEEFTDELYDELYLQMTKNKQKKLKELGAKFLSPRELEAYNLYLKGYNSDEGAKKMKLSSINSYTNVLKMAKDKLRTAEYSKQAQILKKNEEISTNKGDVLLNSKKPKKNLINYTEEPTNLTYKDVAGVIEQVEQKV